MTLMPKPALVNHGTDARLGSSEEARAGGAQAAGLSARQVPRCLNFPTLLSLPQARLVVSILPQDAVKDKKLTLKQSLDCCIPVLQHLLSFCAAGWPTPERWACSHFSRSYHYQNFFTLLSSPPKISRETYCKSYAGEGRRHAHPPALQVKLPAVPCLLASETKIWESRRDKDLNCTV